MRGQGSVVKVTQLQPVGTSSSDGESEVIRVCYGSTVTTTRW